MASSPVNTKTNNKATKISFEPAIQLIKYLINVWISGSDFDFSYALNMPIAFPFLDFGKKYKRKIFEPSRIINNPITMGNNSILY